jgi:putative iron-dependent peroxidase
VRAAISSQGPILAPSARLGRFHVLDLSHPDADPRPALTALASALDYQHAVVGFGSPLLEKLGVSLPGLRVFPALAGPGCCVPSTQGALCCFLGGNDRGELLHASRRLMTLFGTAFRTNEVQDTFTHRDGRDLTGYVDGTENPSGEAAVQAALISGRGAGLDGGSFVAMQRFVHDFDRFFAKSTVERDHSVGRSLATNAELADAPASAHVKRSAQESFDPAAFMVRRSMPFVTPEASGLYFVAFGESLDRFERVLRRMLGMEDGVVDALFGFTRAVSGGYYFCPPLDAGRLDLRALGL